MHQLCIKNGIIVLRGALLKKSALLISGPKIASISPSGGRKSDCQTIDVRGCYISPGFIDTHIHGDPAKIFASEVKTGTTSIVVALSCDRLNRIYRTIGEIKRFVEKGFLGANVLGVRLEGPYINRKKAGAQDPRYIKQPERREALRLIKKCGGFLRIMTIAPELKGAIGVIEVLTESGVIASLGHSDAQFDQALAGIGAGISHATHLFNCMSGIDARQPGAIGAAMVDERVTAEIILDGVHVHSSLFRLLLSSKDRGRIVLITDSVRADPDGGANKRRGVYRLKNGTIAGSSLTMIAALRNAVRIGRLTITDAVKQVSFNPAKLLGVHSRKGAISAGMDADLVIFDKNFDVKVTIIGGRVVYRKKGF